MTHLTQETQEHMADVLASNDNRRIEPDISLPSARMLGLTLISFGVTILLLVAMVIYHFDLEPW